LRSRERESRQRTEELRLRTGTIEAEIYQCAREIQDVNCRGRPTRPSRDYRAAGNRGGPPRVYTELEKLVQEHTAALVQANAALQHERDVLEVTFASIRDAVIITDAATLVTFSLREKEP